MRIIKKGISNWKERERKKILRKKKCPRCKCKFEFEYPHFCKELYERGAIKMNNCNYKYNLPGVGNCCHKYYETEKEDENCPVIHPKLLSSAKKKGDKVCLWCGGKLKNDNESFWSVYCASMWNGEGD